MRTPGRAVPVLALALLLAAGATAQLPELEGEDMPRQAPLPPPPAAEGLAPQTGGDPTASEKPWATFGETLDVALSQHVVRVLADDGAPILGLGAGDFRAVGEGGDLLPVVAAEWYDSGATVDAWQTPPRSAGIPSAPNQAAPGGVRPRGYRRVERLEVVEG